MIVRVKRKGSPVVKHLRQWEDQSVYILREAYKHFDNLAMLWSMGKDSTVLLWLAVALAALAVLSVFVWPRFRPAYVTDQYGRQKDQRERLLDRLADLDDAYAAGELSETTYTVQRADTKARLVALMRQLGPEEKGV